MKLLGPAFGEILDRRAESYQVFIDGEFVSAASEGTYDIINPATSEVIAKVPKCGPEEARKAVDAARESFDKGTWSLMPPSERANIIFRLAGLVEQNIDHLALLETRHQGKPIRMSHGSITFAIDNMRFFAGACRCLEGRASTEYGSAGTSIIRREPVGVVVAITPWNYPFSMFVWKAIPALAAGNTVIVKPASVTPLTTLEFAKLSQKVGMPRGVLNVVTGPGATLGEALVTDPKVDIVGFTGDTLTGRRIMEVASGSVKRVQLELGGKAPFIVFDDADLEAAARGAVMAGFANCGQDCTAATRLYVQENVYSKFLDMVVARIKNVKIGDPQSYDTELGPLVSDAQRRKVEDLVARGVKEGARLLIGGKKPELRSALDRGFYYEPTLFNEARQDMSIVQQEIFGPVLVALPFKTANEAIEKSNDTIYGLSSSVWTNNIYKAMKVSRALRFGCVWINDHLTFLSEMPHGGYKQSGFGKDLSLYALDNYTEIKHIYVDAKNEAANV